MQTTMLDDLRAALPEEDVPELERVGVAKIFTPGAATMDEIVDWVRTNVPGA